MWPCVVTEPTIEEPQINNCGSVLTGSAQTFTWTDPGQTPATVYDFWLGSSFETNNIWDLSGGGTWTNLFANATAIPTDGRTVYKTLFIYRDGIGSTPIKIHCTCTAADLVQNFKIQANFGADVPYGSVTEAMLDSWFTDSDGASYAFGNESLNHMSVVDGCLRIKYEPNTTNGQVGSSRTIFSTAIAPSPCYTTTQIVRLEGPTFDYGGSPGQQTIKLGLGIAGGSGQTSGQGGNVCGYSMRWILRGNEIRGYSYASDIPASFGEDIPTGVIMQPDTDYELTMKVCANTDGNADGSYELFIDGVAVASDFAVRWMDHTQCLTETSNEPNQLINQNFYGGTNSATQSWEPGSTQEINFCSACAVPSDS